MGQILAPDPQESSPPSGRTFRRAPGVRQVSRRGYHEPMDFTSTLALLASALPVEERDWAVIGGLAVGLRGYPRATLDVDILVRREALPRLDATLFGRGYRLEHRWEETSHYQPPPGQLCAIDALHAHRAYALAMLSRAEQIELGQGGLAPPVVQTEDLIGLKLQALVNDPARAWTETADMRRLLEAAAASGRRLQRARLEDYFSLFDRLHLLAELLEGLDDPLR